MWYGVTKEVVKAYSLFLTDIKGLAVTRDNMNVVIPAIVKVVRPDIWLEVRMRSVLRKAVDEGTPKAVERSDIKPQTERQSKLTKQQLIRSKAVYYGIGMHLNRSFDDYVELYELDFVPERELQSWEIMNACYLEMIERHGEATEADKKDYFRSLIAISIGMKSISNVQLDSSEIEELISLWKENYYEF